MELNERQQRLEAERDQLIDFIQRTNSQLEGAKARLNQVHGKIELISELQHEDDPDE
jgi:hypothetical protein